MISTFVFIDYRDIFDVEVLIMGLFVVELTTEVELFGIVVVIIFSVVVLIVDDGIFDVTYVVFMLFDEVVVKGLTEVCFEEVDVF